MEPIRGVYERDKGSGVWWIRWTDAKGKLHREKAGRRGDAQTLLDARRTDAIRQKKLPEKYAAKVTFDSLCDDALEHCKATNTAKVFHDFTLRVAIIRESFGSKIVTDITKQDITRWLTAQAEAKEWKASTQNRWQAAFSLIFRVGIDNERIDRNPAAGIRRKTENNARVRFLSAQEESSLRKVVLNRSPKYIHQLDISLHTGMRAGEQFGLKWEQVSFERKLLSLTKTKNGTARHIPLNAVAMNALKKLYEEQDGSEPVFPSHRNYGSSLQSARGWFRSALTEAKVHGYTWHCNRHSFASRLVMAGVDIRTVGELLGHKSLSMTMRYSHLAPEHNAAAVDRLVAVSQTDTGTTTDTGHSRQ